ncbi:MAG: hypothetical protein K8U57_10895 [Planctomycetes bacterium]|nr:hypothetical protein [Planctomycetota bacterium]
MTITGADGSSLLIDGSDGLYFILVQQADGSQFQPLNTSPLASDVTIMIGGVSTTLPRSCLLDEPTMLRVIREFRDGRLDTSGGWEPL